MKTNRIVIGLLSAAVAVLCLLLLFGRGRPAKIPEPLPEAAGGSDPRTVMIEADNRQIVIENPEGKPISEYLKEAGIPMTGDDILTFSSNQDLTGNVAIQLLRPASVSVLVSTPENPEGVKHTAVLYGGTVADALASVGITLDTNMGVFPHPTTPLRDRMIILVRVHENKPQDDGSSEDGDAGEPTPQVTPDPDPGSPAATNRPAATNKPRATNKPASTPKATARTTPKVTATPKATNAPKPTATPKPTSSRVLISVETYEDCDGSGHGVKVYTYSDGTQEEVYY